MQVGITPEVGDIVWTPETTVYYPLLCAIAGVVAGMFGVGGGIVKGPLMLHLGVLPEVAAATSATMILFTSCACLLLLRKSASCMFLAPFGTARMLCTIKLCAV
jgi:uncharacterized membrane protein YfcA